jgi:hypothetical protein
MEDRQPAIFDGARANHDVKNATQWFERVPVHLDSGDVTAAAQPWQPPSEAFTDMLIDQLLSMVATGDNGHPWSRQLGSYDRSISKALAPSASAARKHSRRH